MKIKILRSTVGNGRDLYSGKIYDVPDKEALMLISAGKAEAVKEKKEEEKAKQDERGKR